MNHSPLQWFVLVSLLAAFVHGDNFTEKYLTMGTSSGFRTKQHRFLTFNTETDGEISIEMQFSVPFIQIPVQKALGMTKGAIANFNVASVIVAGAIVLVTGFLLPAILKFVDQKVVPLPIQPFFQRDGKSELSPDWWSVLAAMDQALTENNVDTTSCMQKVVCWTVRNISASRDKLIDDLMTSEWILKLVEGTAFESAIRNGMDRINCSSKYSACKLNQKAFTTFVKQFTNAINLT